MSSTHSLDAGLLLREQRTLIIRILMAAFDIKADIRRGRLIDGVPGERPFAAPLASSDCARIKTVAFFSGSQDRHFSAPENKAGRWTCSLRSVGAFDEF
jgi:hypothetical protein